mmetsp:Transcript_40070/g.94092  ORF Transcript_40070/g.94092 Transcript_40070/m.94092 type:complete len:157 (+) Transcript_40070:3862-4332(+)
MEHEIRALFRSRRQAEPAVYCPFSPKDEQEILSGKPRHLHGKQQPSGEQEFFHAQRGVSDGAVCEGWTGSLGGFGAAAGGISGESGGVTSKAEVFDRLENEVKFETTQKRQSLGQSVGEWVSAIEQEVLRSFLLRWKITLHTNIYIEHNCGCLCRN